MAAARRRQQANRPSRKIGNIIICAGIATPLIGIGVTKIVSFDVEVYPRVIQSVFIAGALILIAGILVRSYWPDKTDSTARPFDTTGLGCVFMILWPAISFIGGMLFAKESEKAPLIAFIVGGICLFVGVGLFNGGRKRKAALAEEDAPSDAEARPPKIIPGTRPEGFLLVDETGLGCIAIFFAFFTACWYGIVGFVTWYNWHKMSGWVALFYIAGLLPLAMLIHFLRIAFTFEKRAELILPRWPPQSGEEIEMSFQRRLRRNLTVIGIDAGIECNQTEQVGSETKATAIGDQTFTVRDFTESDHLIRARWTMKMPADWPLPSVGGDKEIRWKLKVTISLAQGPNGVSVFPLLVVPPKSSENEADINQSAE